jgi:hypothetical protein
MRHNRIFKLNTKTGQVVESTGASAIDDPVGQHEVKVILDKHTNKMTIIDRGAKVPGGKEHFRRYTEQIRTKAEGKPAQAAAERAPVADQKTRAVSQAEESAARAAAKQRFEELAQDPQTKRTLPKSIEEAEAVLEAEKKGFTKGARRPDLSKGEPNLDFVVDDGHVEIKTPRPIPQRSLEIQALDIAEKAKLYDARVKVIVNLKHLNAAQKAQFKTDLLAHKVDMKRLEFVND